MTDNATATLSDYSTMSISEIAMEVRKNWKKVSPHAQPYLDAMFSLNKISDNYYADTGSSVVAYFLSNATSFTGEAARAIKKELNKRLQNVYLKNKI